MTDQEQALDTARRLAEAGIPVFVAYPHPDKPGDYLPRGRWQQTSANPAYVSAWRPGLALCAVMGQGIDLIDIDPRNGGDTTALNGLTPEVLGAAISPSGGYHLFVRSMGVRSRDGVLPGIDVKAGDPDGDGRGFAFIAPTVRISKTTGEPAAYQWVNAPDLAKLNGHTGADSKLAQLVREAHGSHKQLSTGFSQPTDLERKHAGPIPYGEHHARLVAYAGWLRSKAIPLRPEAEALMLRRLQDCIQPPGADRPRYTEDEALGELHDIYGRYAAGDPAAAQDSPPDGLPISRLEELRSALLDADGLKTIPPPEPLIEGWLYRDSLAWLGGKPGHGKTFIAVDIACCVATGTPWQGHAVTQGSVLYVIAEGISGLAQRVDAWQLAYGQRADNVLFLPIAVQLMDTLDTAAFRALLTETQPRLVILDTQARITVGAEENSSRDMGMFVDALEQLRQASAACIMPVHHEPRNGENLRGSTALEGAAASILRVSKDGSLLEVTNPKQKDTPEQDPLRLALNPLGVSATVSLATGAITTNSERELLTTLQGFGTSGASKTELVKASGIPDRTAHRAMNVLVNKGLVVNTGTSTRTCYLPASLDNRQEVP